MMIMMTAVRKKTVATRLRHALAAVVLMAFVASGCRPRTEPVAAKSPPTNPPPSSAPAVPNQRVRLPAVAGLFYPAQEGLLSRTLDALLANASAHPVPRLRALVCPHAGYSYSGPTAAVGYKAVAGRTYDTVVIMGPSHYAAFTQASIPDAAIYQTPLGGVPISGKAAALVKAGPPFVVEPRCQVQRPDWWRDASRPAPPQGEDTPETWEHSVEVQVPFLQKVLKRFTVLPMILGEANPEQIAAGLAGVWDEKTLIVASTDLSHYHAYDDAKKLDDRCVNMVLNLDIAGMKEQEACGKVPTLALMHLARQKGWKTRLLDYRNSGDVSGQKSRVVGYTAIAFYEPLPEKVSAADRKFLLGLARQTLLCAATNGALPVVDGQGLSPALSEVRACFVTLTVDGALRGCIGHIYPQQPLYRAVVDNAQNAATRDPRFQPVRPEEVDRIRIEVSVLTDPEPLRFASPEELLGKLNPHEDGVVLRVGGRGATFLPQVWGQIPDREEFLNHLAQKAGCDPSAWRGPETSVSVYRVECFEESE